MRHIALDEGTPLAHYLIESPHSGQLCLEARDQVAAIGQWALDQYYWSCPALHTGWAIVEAVNEAAARNLVPARFQANARVIPAQRMSLEKLKAAHSNL